MSEKLLNWISNREFSSPWFIQQNTRLPSSKLDFVADSAVDWKEQLMTGDVSQHSDRMQRPPFWMKLLRPAVTIPVTLLAFILAGLGTYRLSRFRGIPVITEVVDRETEGRIKIKDEENAFT